MITVHPFAPSPSYGKINCHSNFTTLVKEINLVDFRFWLVLCFGVAHYIGSIFALTQEAIRYKVYVNIG